MPRIFQRIQCLILILKPDAKLVPCILTVTMIVGIIAFVPYIIAQKRRMSFVAFCQSLEKISSQFTAHRGIQADPFIKPSHRTAHAHLAFCLFTLRVFT